MTATRPGRRRRQAVAILGAAAKAKAPGGARPGVVGRRRSEPAGGPGRRWPPAPSRRRRGDADAGVPAPRADCGSTRSCWPTAACSAPSAPWSGPAVPRWWPTASKELMRSLLPLGIDITVAGPRHRRGRLPARPVVGPLPPRGRGRGAAGAGPRRRGGGRRRPASSRSTGPAEVERVHPGGAQRGGPRAARSRPCARPSSRAGLERLHDEVERPLVRVLARMEVAGIARRHQRAAPHRRRARRRVRPPRGARSTSSPARRSTSTRRRSCAPCSTTGSGSRPGRKTKTGFSTDASTLEKLRGQHPIVDTLLRYREVEKLRSTYGETLLAEVAADGRIHATFGQTVARTGRLSSDRPNLHNIPVRTEEGRRLRKAFIPADGCRLLGGRLRPDRAARHRPPLAATPGSWPPSPRDATSTAPPPPACSGSPPRT